MQPLRFQKRNLKKGTGNRLKWPVSHKRIVDEIVKANPTFTLARLVAIALNERFEIVTGARCSWEDKIAEVIKARFERASPKDPWVVRSGIGQSQDVGLPVAVDGEVVGVPVPPPTPPTPQAFPQEQMDATVAPPSSSLSSSSRTTPRVPSAQKRGTPSKQNDSALPQQQQPQQPPPAFPLATAVTTTNSTENPAPIRTNTAVATARQEPARQDAISARNSTVEVVNIISSNSGSRATSNGPSAFPSQHTSATTVLAVTPLQFAQRDLDTMSAFSAAERRAPLSQQQQQQFSPQQQQQTSTPSTAQQQQQQQQRQPQQQQPLPLRSDPITGMKFLSQQHYEAMDAFVFSRSAAETDEQIASFVLSSVFALGHNEDAFVWHNLFLTVMRSRYRRVDGRFRR